MEAKGPNIKVHPYMNTKTIAILPENVRFRIVGLISACSGEKVEVIVVLQYNKSTVQMLLHTF